MTTPLKFITTFLIALTLAGCSKAMVKSDSDPNTDLSSIETIYVRKLPADGRGIEKIIADKLIDFGFNATSGANTVPPSPVDAVVTYKDRWMWDITMYMLEIDIEFHAPDSQFVFASGKSYRTSLVRESPEYMIDEVLRDIFAGIIDLPEIKESNIQD